MSGVLPEFMKPSEVAKLLDVSKMTVYRMIHSGEIPYQRCRHTFRIPGYAVEAVARQYSELHIEDPSTT